MSAPGIEPVSIMYCPVRRCHQMSVSMILCANSDRPRHTSRTTATVWTRFVGPPMPGDPVVETSSVKVSPRFHATLCGGNARADGIPRGLPRIRAATSAPADRNSQAGGLEAGPDLGYALFRHRFDAKLFLRRFDSLELRFAHLVIRE